MLNLQAPTDRFKGVGREGPATIRDQGHGGARAQTGGIEHGQRYPTGLRGGYRARQHRARIAVEDDQAPPAVALQGKIHHASVDTPVFVRRCRFEGMGLRLGF